MPGFIKKAPSWMNDVVFSPCRSSSLVCKISSESIAYNESIH